MTDSDNDSSGAAKDEVISTSALMAIIEQLKPLSSAIRRRTVDAAMVFLGEGASYGATPAAKSTSAGGGGPSNEHIAKWMEQNGVSQEELDRAFHFHDDGSFDLLDAPGSKKKEKTLATYVLTGLGNYLTTNSRSFDDATARRFCETIGCLDSPNHATTLKASGADFTGDKKKGYTLTNVGIKSGATFVKALK